ncbi:hypothetical protein Sjap_020580 [Stephania japonica]|uniref:DNA mismatch repair protein MSH3 n=1 Tax=Stephania japonica TaxID=461633 RepID=A0AAP0F0Y6_9MAGN
MVEVGYKFRFFGEDAEAAARVLGIYAHMDHNFLTASVPTFRLSVHVRRLVNAGFKVGVVKQTETAAIKAHGGNRLGPFHRGLSALYTKATLEAALDVGEEGFGLGTSYLICVVEKGAAVAVEDGEGGVEGRFDVRIGFVAVEVSTGDVVHGEFNDNVMRDALEAVLLTISPAEVIIGEPVSKQTEKLLLAYSGPSSNVRVERASCVSFKDGGALAQLMTLYENIDEDDAAQLQDQNMDVTDGDKHLLGVQGIMAMPGLTIQALTLIVHHLKQFGFERILRLGASFRPFSSNNEMTLSANTLQQLEILKNNSDGTETGSLLHIMNRTLTVFGSRLLRYWVTHPLRDKNSIAMRLDAVSEIADSMGSCTSWNVGEDDNDGCVAIINPELHHVLSSVFTTLGRSPDIQRGITRIFHKTATASEFIQIMQAILFAAKQLQQLQVEDRSIAGNTQEKIVHSALLRRLILAASSPTVVAHAVKLLSFLSKDAADQGDLQSLFSNGCKEGDHFQSTLSLAEPCRTMRLPTDRKAPPDWLIVNSTKKTIRYHPPEVLESLDKLLLAQEELSIACRSCWSKFLEGFGNYYAEFLTAVQALAALDCLHSLAILSRNKLFHHRIMSAQFSQMKMTPFRCIFNLVVTRVGMYDTFLPDLEMGFSCIIEHLMLGTARTLILEPEEFQFHGTMKLELLIFLLDNFVPNDTYLSADGEYCQIIMGPNMGGKSCYIRQVALIALMGQVGSFVPATSAKLQVLDGIHTRMGASDSIQQGKSTFLEEMSETSNILHNSTSRSLVIIDELGRGTSTHDGVAIAYATLHHLLEHKKCMVLFVTHYPKVLDIKDRFPGSVGAYHVSYLTSKNPLKIPDFELDRDTEYTDHTDVTFLYKLVPGMTDKSFGLNVARLAQLPSKCIARAATMSMKLEELISARTATKLAQLQNLRSGHEYCHCPNLVGSSLVEAAEGIGKLRNSCGELFQMLNLALIHADATPTTFESLKHASSLAAEILEGTNLFSL